MMKLIPAIDLMGGAVVQAQGGIRQKYRPLHTALFPDADVIKVIQTLLKLLDTNIIYLADLDAIGKQGNQRNLIATIGSRFPEIEFWVDVGIGGYNDFTSLEIPPSAIPVVGTETLTEGLECFAGEHYILSLDFKNGRLLGPNVLTQMQYWPSRIIALCLDRIGSSLGPDTACLKQLCIGYEGEVYAGGGVRNHADLRVLSEIGMAGALTANAVYNGALSNK